VLSRIRRGKRRKRRVEEHGVGQREQEVWHEVTGGEGVGLPVVPGHDPLVRLSVVVVEDASPHRGQP